MKINFARDLFIERLNSNNENLMGFITELEFFITNNPVIDTGGVLHQVISTFASNFMRNFSKLNKEFIANENNIYIYIYIYCTFKSVIRTAVK